MAEHEDDVEIRIDDEAPVQDADIVVEKAEVPPKKAVIDADEGLETLKQRLAQSERDTARERSARIDAERNVVVAKGEVHDTQLSLVTNAIETVKQSSATLKSQYRDAMAVGDYDTAADVQEQMSNNAARLLQLEQGKTAMEEAPKPTVAASRSADPVEALASQLTARSAAWVRAHPECATDERLYRKMLAAHNLATADGIAVDSDEYFTSVEQSMGFNARREDTHDDPLVEAAKPVQRRTSPSAAPPSRSGTGGGDRPNVVRLSAEEREMAKMMQMTDTEYAKNKLALKRDGRLN